MTWGYVAGFFDGEGSLVESRTGYRVTITQTSEAVLKQIASFTGVGSVAKVTKRQLHWQDSWVYYVSSQKSVRHFLEGIRRFSIVKRRGIERALPAVRRATHRINLQRQHLRHLAAKVQKLRATGLTYRAIGKRYGIDYGHARRLCLRQR